MGFSGSSADYTGLFSGVFLFGAFLVFAIFSLREREKRAALRAFILMILVPAPFIMLSLFHLKFLQSFLFILLAVSLVFLIILLTPFNSVQ